MQFASSNMGEYEWGWCQWLSPLSAGYLAAVSVGEKREILVGILCRTVRGL